MGESSGARLGKIRQTLAVVSCTSGIMMAILANMWYSPIQRWLSGPQSEIPMTPLQVYVIILIVTAGQIFGYLFANLMSLRLGRKTVLLMSLPLILIGWAVMALTRSYAWLLAVRIVHGVALGLIYSLTPVYSIEVIDPSIRGQTGAFINTCCSLGIIYANVIGPKISYQNYIYACASTALPFISFFFMPESPYSLLKLGKEEEAFTSLTWLRGGQPVHEELTSIKHLLAEEKEAGSALTRPMRTALLVVITSGGIPYFAGVGVLLFFTSDIQIKSGFSDPYVSSLIFCCLNVAASIASIPSATWCGRKPLILIGFGIMAVSSLCIAVQLHLQNSKIVPLDPWLITVLLLVYNSIYHTCVSPVSGTIQAEYFSTTDRSIATSISSFSNTFCGLISTLIYFFAADKFGLQSVFYLYSVANVFGSIFMYSFMKETAGKTLQEIREMHSEAVSDHSLKNSTWVPTIQRG